MHMLLALGLVMHCSWRTAKPLHDGELSAGTCSYSASDKGWPGHALFSGLSFGGAGCPLMPEGVVLPLSDGGAPILSRMISLEVQVAGARSSAYGVIAPAA